MKYIQIAYYVITCVLLLAKIYTLEIIKLCPCERRKHANLRCLIQILFSIGKLS